MKKTLALTTAAIMAISLNTQKVNAQQQCSGGSCNTPMKYNSKRNKQYKKSKKKRNKLNNKRESYLYNKKNDDFEKNTLYGVFKGGMGEFDSNTNYQNYFANFNGGLLIKPSVYTNIDLNMELESGFNNNSFQNAQLIMKGLVGLGNNNTIKAGLESNFFETDGQVKMISELKLNSKQIGEWMKLEGKLGTDFKHDIQANLKLSPHFAVGEKTYLVPTLRAHFAQNPLTEEYKTRMGTSLTAGLGIGNIQLFVGGNYQVQDQNMSKFNFSKNNLGLIAGIEIKLGLGNYVERVTTCPGLSNKSNRYNPHSKRQRR